MAATYHFLCCLPVRLGVFVLSILTLLLGGALSGFTWYGFVKIGPANMEGVQKASFIISGLIYGFLAIFSFLGLIGASTRGRGLVATYGFILWVMLIANLATSIYLIVMLFKGNLADNLKEQCSNPDLLEGLTQAAADEAKRNCEQVLNILKGVIIAFVVIILLIIFYACIIVQRYVSQLDDEEDEKYGQGRSDNYVGKQV
jgi:hypothetical protein